jgi:hypothetical protein
MILDSYCPPAILYLGFSVTQILIDTFKGMYNTAFFKFVVMIVFATLLNILCSEGLGIISWFIVFVPFILMTYVTTILLFVFGLSPSKGKIDYNVAYTGKPSHENPHEKPHVIRDVQQANKTKLKAHAPKDYSEQDNIQKHISTNESKNVDDSISSSLKKTAS